MKRCVVFSGMLLAACYPSPAEFALDPKTDACANFAGSSCLDLRVLGSGTLDSLTVTLVDKLGRQYTGVVMGPVTLPSAVAIHGFESKYNLKSDQIAAVRVSTGTRTKSIAISAWPSGAHYQVSVEL